MTFANNGAAIIGNVVVPPSEVKVLRALSNMGRPATVPEIAKVLQDEFSDASLYSLLGRLAEKRRLVDRIEVKVDVLGTALRRITWMAVPAATLTFQKAINDKQENEGSTGHMAQALC